MQYIESSLSKILEQSSTEVYIIDMSSLRFLYSNSAARKNLGYTLKELLEMSLADISPQAHSKAGLLARFNSQESQGKEIPGFLLNSTHQRKDGSRYPVELHLQLTEYDNKKACVAFVHDASDKQKNLDQLNAVIKGANVGYWDWNYQTSEHDVNNRWLEMIGYNRSDLKNHVTDWRDRIHPDDRDITPAAIEKAIKDNKPYIIEFRMMHKKGHWVWIQGSGSVVERNPHTNEPLRLCGTHMDISQHKKDELELHQRAEKYRILTENTQDVIMQFDRERRYIYVNPAIKRFRDIEPADYIGKTHEDMGFPDKLSSLCSNAIERTFLSGSPQSETFSLQTKIGKIYIDWQLFPAFSRSGEVASVFSVSRDITQFKKAEEEVQKVQKLESLGILAGGIAHDFNNILTILFGNIALAKSQLPENHDSFDSLEKAEQAFNRATNLTKQLLTFSKGGAPIKQDVSTAKLIEDVTRFDLSGSNVKLIFEPDKNLWMAQADKGQIEQVFSNLTINANQAMVNGGHLYISAENINITEGIVDNLKPGHYIKFIIQDEGKGIPAEEIKKIFDPYYSTKDTGNGLGLATVYSIINKHGGHIDVYSRVDEGTSFTFYLPASKAAYQQEGELIEEARDNSKSARILLMDDEEMIRNLATDMLEHAGYSVETANDGNQAIAMYQQAMEQQPFNCVIMDLTIPGGMGGAEALQKILALDPDARVIVSSGYAADSVMGSYTDAGFKGAIDKPFSLKELHEEVHRVLTE